MYDEETIFVGNPGPVLTHPRVYRAMNKPTYGHRTSHFREIYDDAAKKFAQTINTSRDIQFHTGSGSLGLHAGVSNLVSREDTVINCVNGKFGERVEQITEVFAGTSVPVRVDWGKAIRPEMVKEALETHPETKLVTITHNETSTGILNPLPEISKVVHDHGALLLADCITSAGGDLVMMDEWQIDVFVSGSQKCYGLPPGLAFIVISEAAEEAIKANPNRLDFYSDLLTFQKKIVKRDPPFTPAINLMYGLQESLNIILEEGMDNRIARHRKMASAYRKGLQAIGVDLFAEEGYRSNTVTPGVVPEGVTWKNVSQFLLKNGVSLAGGQNEVSGKIFRFGHMNLVGPREVLMVMSLLELGLKNEGADISLGDGVRTIQEALLS